MGGKGRRSHDFDYSNFKGVVAQTPGQQDKLAILHRIWELMCDYQFGHEE